MHIPQICKTCVYYNNRNGSCMLSPVPLHVVTVRSDPKMCGPRAVWLEPSKKNLTGPKRTSGK